MGAEAWHQAVRVKEGTHSSSTTPVLSCGMTNGHNEPQISAKTLTPFLCLSLTAEAGFEATLA
jgi:hypothetical protein